MATETSSIDDVLATAHLPHEAKELPLDTPGLDEPEPEQDAPEPEEAPQRDSDSDAGADTDDYGNESPKQESKTYTEDEVSERINKAVRERLARMKDSAPAAQPTQQQQKQASDAGFEYDESSSQDWQQQLKQFIRQTNEEVFREQQQQQQSEREQQVQVEFEDKFHRGMGKFADFRDVVGQQAITDAMTVATRSMNDPAAFLYAASKRHGDELKRISNLSDPYAQMVEMGKLEERMRKSKTTSKAPRPLSNTREDSTIREPEKRQPTIEDMIMANDARRLKNMRNRRG